MKLKILIPIITMLLLVPALVNATVSLGYWNGNLVYNTSFEETGKPSNWTVVDGIPDWDNTDQAFDGSESLVHTTDNFLAFPSTAFDKSMKRNYSVAVYCPTTPGTLTAIMYLTNNLRMQMETDGTMRMYHNPSTTNMNPDVLFPIDDWFILQADMDAIGSNFYFINASTGDVIASTGRQTASDTETNNRNVQGTPECFYDLFQSGNGTFQPLGGGEIDTTPPNVTLINLTSEATRNGDPGYLIYNLSKTGEELGLLSGLAKTNDTTPTFHVNTNESARCAVINNNSNLNYSDITAGSAECATTGSTHHICTLPSANETGRGIFNFSIGCKDSVGNEHPVGIKFSVNITTPPASVTSIFISLDGLNESRSYELGSTINLSANCTLSTGDCVVCINFTAPNTGGNFSCNDDFTSFTYNLSILRNENFTGGGKSLTITAGRASVNISSNNLTIMESVSLNITSSGTSTNVNISYFGKTIEFRGDLKTIYLIDNTFIESNEDKIAVNLTYISAGSNFIFVNLSDVSNPINLTFQLSGFDLDLNNEVDYTEHFNGTDGSVGFNETLSFHTDAPLGIFDDFVTNVSDRWEFESCTAPNPILRYTSDGHGNYLEMRNNAGEGESVTCDLIYNDVSADFRNTSRMEFDLLYVLSASRTQNADCSANTNWKFLVTDGTNNIELDTVSVSKSTNPGGTITARQLRNYTLIKKSSDDKIFEVIRNGTSLGNKDFSSLDFTKQIEFKHRLALSASSGSGDCSASGQVFQYEVKWGGAWLNRSTNNGIYKSNGNITSCVDRSTDALSKATLIATDYTPIGTRIDYSLSNNNGTTFEAVTSGITHTFSSVGASNSELCWRAELNSSINITSKILSSEDFFIKV